jgi:hypothetical protein
MPEDQGNQYQSVGPIAIEYANDAGAVNCNKPEAQAKGIE